ncbi:MAG: hypothetical protein LBV74_16145 [Tannerella sp.]|jgi:membrane protein CcdC involved in cytochrome C biogenesis|nr:hypothetical protein [Tannerella sp.]
MTITFDFDINDMMAFQEHLLIHTKQFKNTKLFVTLLLPVMLVALFCYYWIDKGMGPGLVGIGIFLAFAGIISDHVANIIHV